MDVNNIEAVPVQSKSFEEREREAALLANVPVDPGSENICLSCE